MSTTTPTRAELEQRLAALRAEKPRLHKAYCDAVAAKKVAIPTAVRKVKEARHAMTRCGNQINDLEAQLAALAAPAPPTRPTPKPTPEPEPADAPEADAAPARTTKKKRTTRRAD